MTKISFNINVKTTKQRLWEIVTHPEKYASFLPGIKEVIVLQRDDLVSLIRWKILIDSVEVQWTEQCHYDKRSSKFSFQMTRGDFSTYDGTISIEHSGKWVNLALTASLDWNIPSFEKVVSKVIEEKTARAFKTMLLGIKQHAEKNGVERSFAFVIHPLDLNLISIAFREPNITSKRLDLVSKLFEWVPPFKCSDIVGLKSIDGKEIDGALIYCPLLPEQMVANRGELALRRTIESVKVAESLGVKLVGLGAYTAQIGRKGLLVAEAVNVPITTGTSYTIATAIQGVETACQLVGTDIKQVKVGIIGATGGIGGACAEILGGKVDSLILNARNKTRLDDLVIRLKEKSPSVKLTQTTEIDWLIANSDVVITATNTPSSLIDARSLQPGTIVCDISRPRNVNPESVLETGNSVLVFDGGIVKLPGEVDFDFYFGLPPGIAYACMAETMILALAQRYEGYSVGGNINAEKISEIARLGNDFGFGLAELRWCEKEIPQQVFDSVREHIKKKNIRAWH